MSWKNKAIYKTLKDLASNLSLLKARYTNRYLDLSDMFLRDISSDNNVHLSLLSHGLGHKLQQSPANYGKLRQIGERGKVKGER